MSHVPVTLSHPVKPDDEGVLLAELIETPPPAGRVVRIWRSLTGGAEWLMGLACIVVGVAALAALPVLQLLSFGYLLEVSGRIARERRLRSGFVGIRKAARVGFLIAHTWLMILPLRILTDYWHDALLIDPTGAVARNLRTAQVVMALTLSHIAMAWYCGGRARYFYWPLLLPWHLIRSLLGRLAWSEWFPPALLWRHGGDFYVRARDGLWDFVASLRLPYYFRLGALGLVGAVAWLAIPVLLLAGASTLPPGPATLSGLLGGLLLAIVAVRLPFLETRFAATGRFDALWDRRAVADRFARAPIAFWLALLLTLGLAVPLHLIQAAPPLLPELRWLLNVLFVLLLLPARLATGWAMARAERHPDHRMLLSRWGSRLALIPVAGFYALVIYASQFINFYGSWRLLEQPAFLLPAPFWLIP